MTHLDDFDKLRIELSIKAKNGIDFIVAASAVWLAIAYVWTLPYSSHNKSILTFIIGGFMLPLAFVLSKVLKTTWTVKTNALQPLGLWLNFAQLLYFPFLFFVLSKMPDYFVMVYVIITGAHFFPYAWYYKTNIYAIVSGITAFGALFIGLNISVEKMYVVPLLMSAALILLAILLYFLYKRRIKIESVSVSEPETNP